MRRFGLQSEGGKCMMFARWHREFDCLHVETMQALSTSHQLLPREPGPAMPGWSLMIAAGLPCPSKNMLSIFLRGCGAALSPKNWLAIQEQVSLGTHHAGRGKLTQRLLQGFRQPDSA